MSSERSLGRVFVVGLSSLLVLMGVFSGKALDWESGPGFRSAAVVPVGAGKTGFTLLSPEVTGVFFTNVITPDRHLTNQMLLNGSGVTAGDVDGDGWVDLFFSSLGEGRPRLYRNRGQWKFEDVTEPSGLATPPCRDSTGCALADVDGDDDLDLVLNTFNCGTHIFVNDGRGRFALSDQNPGLNGRRCGLAVALADYDGDGALDLYIGNYRAVILLDQPDTKFTFRMVDGKPVVTMVDGLPLTDPSLTNRFKFHFTLTRRGLFMQREEFGEPDQLYRNDGRGRFLPVPWTDGTFLDEAGQPLAHPPFDWTLSVTFRDLNGDGWPDLYACSDFRTPDRIWLNDRRGHFRAAPPLAFRHTAISTMGVDVADINRDGHDDILTVDMLSRSHRLRYLQRTDIQPEALPVGAIENRPQYARNMLALNRGDGTYAEIGYLSGLEASEWSWTPLFLDVDLDGYEDLLVSNGFERDGMNMDVIARIEAAKAQRKMSREEMLRLRTMFPRLATANLAFRNLGNLRFADVSEAWGFAHPGVTQGMIAADLDNDGDLDVVGINLNAAAFVFRNDTAAPRVAVRLRGKPPNTRGVGAKITVRGGPVPVQSQQLMIGGRFQSSDDALRTFACGAATHLTIEVAWRSGARSVIRDARPNRIYEIDERAADPAPEPRKPNLETRTFFFEDVSSRLGHAHHEEPFDDFERQPLLSRKLSQLGPGVSWFDVDADGWEDLLVAGGRGGSLAAFHNDGRGGFRRLEGAPWAEPTPRDQTTVLGWRRTDGSTRLLVGLANYEDGRTDGSAVVSCEPNSKAPEGLLPAAASSPGPLAMADLDGDGQLDLFVGGRVVPGRFPEPASSRLFRGNRSTFQPDAENTKRLAGVGLVSGAVFTDLDGDGDPDLVLACEWGPIRIFRNERGRLTPWDWGLTTAATAARPSQPATLEQLTGWWTGVNAGDFDGDGRLDLVAGNWGRNTKYENWRAHPLRLYAADLEGNGTLDLVESCYDDAMRKWVPVEVYNVVGPALPWLREPFGTWEAYAHAGVDELFGEPLRQARLLEAVCLETMVFLNRGDRFEARELPLEAQFSPAFAACVADLDGDGGEDLFLSQNFFATHVETARLDAGRGLWLKGDGAGGFTPVPGQESGLLVYGEQRGAAVCDYDHDGRVDLAVSQNAAPTRLYRNVGAKPGLRVRLVGPPGNPQAVGAVLRLVDAAGRAGPAREIHAGSGYWSQDAAVQVMSAPFEPRQLRVRWPGGRETMSEIPAGARAITVEMSGQVTRPPGS